MSAVAGVSLNLERLVLVGFQLSPPDAQQAPVLWPGGLVSGSGEQLNMTDVRVVINSQELFNKYLTWFTASNTLLWTVSQRESRQAAAAAAVAMLHPGNSSDLVISYTRASMQCPWL